MGSVSSGGSSFRATRTVVCRSARRGAGVFVTETHTDFRTGAAPALLGCRVDAVAAETFDELAGRAAVATPARPDDDPGRDERGREGDGERERTGAGARGAPLALATMGVAVGAVGVVAAIRPPLPAWVGPSAPLLDGSTEMVPPGDADVAEAADTTVVGVVMRPEAVGATADASADRPLAAASSRATRRSTICSEGTSASAIQSFMPVRQTSTRSVSSPERKAEAICSVVISARSCPEVLTTQSLLRAATELASKPDSDGPSHPSSIDFPSSIGESPPPRIIAKGT